jgi:hypothetical protein
MEDGITVRQHGKPTLHVQRQGSLVLMSEGENNYVVIQNKVVIREGNFASANEAKAELKPKNSKGEYLYIRVGRQI